jgi:hypothetical protein
MVHLKDVFETIIGQELLDGDICQPISGIQAQDRNYGAEMHESKNYFGLTKIGVEGTENNTLKQRLIGS